MNLKINAINFQGRNEVLYGLNNAANNIHSYSIYRQPRLMMRGENRNLDKYEATALAYLDMVTKDEFFVKTANKINLSELKDIAKNLKPVMTMSGKVSPIDYFREMIEQVMDKNGTNTPEGINALESLLEKLYV